MENALADVPAIAETIRDFDVVVWFGVLAPARTPPTIIARLNEAIKGAVATKAVQDKLIGIGVEPKTSDPEEFARIIAADVSKWAKVVKEAGLSAQPNGKSFWDGQFVRNDGNS